MRWCGSAAAGVAWKVIVAAKVRYTRRVEWLK
jgi:hypothetical protein